MRRSTGISAKLRCCIKRDEKSTRTLGKHDVGRRGEARVRRSDA